MPSQSLNTACYNPFQRSRIQHDAVKWICVVNAVARECGNVYSSAPSQPETWSKRKCGYDSEAQRQFIFIPLHVMTLSVFNPLSTIV